MSGGGRVESIVSPFPSGSARKRDYTWPDPNNNIAGGPSNNVRDRAGGSVQSGSQSPGTSGAITMGVINGVDCARFTNGVNVGGGPTFNFSCACMRSALLSANLHFTPSGDDYGAYRVYAIMRMTASPNTVSQECGLTLHNGNNATDGLFTGTGPGFAFYYNTTGGIDYVIKGDNAAFTTIPAGTVAGGFLNTAFHVAEFRIISAQQGANASIKAIFDNIVIDQRSWPNNLPSPAGVGGNTANAFIPNIKANSPNCELDLAVLRAQYAPFESALF